MNDHVASEVGACTYMYMHIYSQYYKLYTVLHLCYKSDLSGPETELAGLLIFVFQINSVVMSFGMFLLAAVERFLHYLRW